MTTSKKLSFLNKQDAGKPTKPSSRSPAAPETEYSPLQGLDDPLSGQALGGDDPVASASVGTLLALTVLQSLMTRRDLARIAKSNGVAMLVTVPGPDWVKPMERALNSVGLWREVVARTGARQDKPDQGNERVGEVLSAGHNLAGVCHAPALYLPSALAKVADIRLDIGTPSNRVLRAVIRLATGRHPQTLPPLCAAGLSFDTLTSCIRRGSTAAEARRRLVAASRPAPSTAPGDADLPHLADAWGYEGEAREFGLELIDAVEAYRRGEIRWADIEVGTRALVLGGDPGVGKSLYARILAKSCKSQLVSTSVSAWFSQTGGYLNEVVKQIDTVIAQAVACGPGTILFLDEFDALPNRATTDGRNRDYWTPLITHMLLALDSAVSGATSSLIIIAATNFPDRVDEALCRPGRLNRVVTIRRPGADAITGILRQHLRGALPNTDLRPLASLGAGATGAEVAGWAKGARAKARSAGRGMILADLLAQVVLPETRSQMQLLAVAQHEAAHAVATELLHVGTVETVTIVARNSFAGRTASKLRNADAMTKGAADDFVTVILAGRAADEARGGVTSASAGGPGSDLAAATAVIAAMHFSWGLGNSILCHGTQEDALATLRYDPAARWVVEIDLRRLYAAAKEFVRVHADTIEAVAARLMEARVIGGDEVRRIIAATAIAEPSPSHTAR